MNTQSKANKVIKNIKKQANTAVAVKKSSVISVYAIVCFLFAFALYSNTLKHAYVLDDNDNFTKNTVITKGVVFAGQVPYDSLAEGNGPHP